jgi:hypothetical protein
LNRAELNKRIQEINNEKILLQASLSKLEGHLSESLHWLSLIEKQEKQEKEEEKKIEENQEVKTDNPYETKMYVE